MMKRTELPELMLRIAITRVLPVRHIFLTKPISVAAERSGIAQAQCMLG